MDITIEPLSESLGVAIEGFSPRDPVTDEMRSWLISLIAQHGLILLRCPGLSQADQIAFGEQLGRVPDQENEHAWAVRTPRWGEQRPSPVYRAGQSLFFTNGPNLAEGSEDPSAIWSEDTTQEFAGRHTSCWHTGDTDRYRVERVNALYAVEVPPRGGTTWFANTMAAFADLDEGVKEEFRGYRVLHFFAHLRQRPVDQPLVKLHPSGSGEYLYLNYNTMDRIIGLDREASNEVLARTYFHSTQSKYLYEHHWQPGDFLVWNCLGTMHRRGILFPGMRRVLGRIQIEVPELQSRRESDMTREAAVVGELERWSNYPFSRAHAAL